MNLLFFQNILVKFAKLTGATVSKLWKPDVTHVIASTDENGACTRTYKVLMGILNGIWILNMDCKYNSNDVFFFLKFCFHLDGS